MSNPTDFPAALKREMERRGLSQSELAKLAGVSQGAVSMWLGGTREPGASALFRLADALGVKVDRLRA